MRHQNHSSETQEAQTLRVHPYRPENQQQAWFKRKDLIIKYFISIVNLPIKKWAKDGDAQSAEWQDVEDVGQEHLPFMIETILTLLITDGSQRRD